MRILKTKYGSQKILANQVYQEYIRDYDHIHMNGTKWLSLNAFVEWLGENNYCEIEETTKGWYINIIDKEPEELKKEYVEFYFIIYLILVSENKGKNGTR